MAIELDHMFLRVAEHFIDLLLDCWFRLFFQLSVPAGYWRKELFLRIEISFLTCLRLLDWTGDTNFRPLNFSGRPWQPFWRPNISHEVVHKVKEVETPVKQREQCYHATFVDYLTYIQPPPTVAKRSAATCWNLSANPWQMFFLVFFFSFNKLRCSCWKTIQTMLKCVPFALEKSRYTEHFLFRSSDPDTCERT